MEAIKSSSNSKYHVPAIERGMAVIEILAQSSHSLSLTDISKRLDVTSGTLFRVLTTLEILGYVNKNDISGNYSLSLKLYELAHTQPPVANLLNASAIPMETLAHQLNESCHLSVLRNGKLVVLKEALSPSQIRLSVSIGSQFPAVKTSSGRLLLAFLEDDQLHNVLNNSNEYKQYNEVQRKALHAKLDEIRIIGVSTSENENHLGIEDAAILVGNPRVRLTAALAVTWLIALEEPNHRQHIIDGLKESALDITNSMGLSDDY
jgi:DNA-binding IclR family transcriptional regulator